MDWNSATRHMVVGSCMSQGVRASHAVCASGSRKGGGREGRTTCLIWKSMTAIHMPRRRIVTLRNTTCPLPSDGTGWSAGRRVPGGEGTFYRDLLNHAARRAARTRCRDPGAAFNAILLAEAGFDVTRHRRRASHGRQGARKRGATRPRRAVRGQRLARSRVARCGCVRCRSLPWKLAFTSLRRGRSRRNAGNLQHGSRGGGTLILDQRNHDAILDGTAPPQGDRTAAQGPISHST